ncbi:MAG: hypothetical protein JXA03_05320, partial [Bacteroidales bacterium]|nr:hypothetical protein [Bacteroidales bacterium]
PGVKGYIEYKKYKSSDEWLKENMLYGDGKLKGSIPTQPAAGKIIYNVWLHENGQFKMINAKPVIIRFTGSVPAYVLIPHIILMFLAMLLSNFTGMKAVFRIAPLKKNILFVVITLFSGGLILGPVVQKYAFGEFWTGWPFGHDLTDNKTLVAFVFWFIALIAALKNRKSAGTWVIVAAIVLLLMYLIPHSMWGSELDYASGTITTGNN